MAKETVHVLSHSHWDREWYLPVEEHRMRLVELFDDLFELFETDPEFKSVHLDGQTIVLEDYLEIRPQNRDKLKKYIDEGRLVIGSFYILQDAYLITGEAHVRNALIGHIDSQKWGKAPKIGYYPDTFGNVGQVPQLMQQAGIDVSLFGRGVKPVGFDNQVLSDDKFQSSFSEMNWQGADGSQVLGILFANWYSNGNEIPAKKAISLGALDYLVKPINKKELAQILLRVSTEEMNQENQHQRWREVVRGREELATLLTVDQPLYLLAEAAPVTDQFTIERMIGQQSFYFYFLPQLPHQSVFFVEEIDATSRMDVVVDKIERKLFYGHIPKKLQATTRAFYQELLPHLESGQVHRLEQALPDIVEKLQSAAPAVYLTKQLFNQIMTDVYHRFKQLERSRLEDYFQKIESSQDLQTLLTVTLSHLLDIRERHQYSHHVEEVLDIIKREYQTELTLKEVSDRLFLNTVYLGQIIKKETGATFAELLNRKRIKMAQQLLVTGDYGIEEICFRVGYTNIGYFYKIFKRFCG